MKRTLFSILGLFLAAFTVLTFINSCEVEHFYEAEITVVNAAGELKPGSVSYTHLTLPTKA